MFQDLSSATKICIDLETKDLTLKEKGCGALRGGEILGIGIATDTSIREYYSIGHVDSNNFNPQQVFDYLKRELGREAQIKVGANILYDLEYLAVNGVEVKGRIADVLLAEPLIDENQFQYNLDGVAKKYLGETKKTQELEDRAKVYGLKGDFRQHIWRFSAEAVREYAIADVDLPLRIFEEQKKILTAEELLPVFTLESKLIPLLLQMKIRGCPIDENATCRLIEELVYKQGILKKKIENVGLDVTTSHESREKIAQFLLKHNYNVPYTAKTNRPSVTAPYLKTIEREEIQWIIEYKQYEKLVGTFLKSQLQGNALNGRIHAQFNQLRDSDGGTVTGRFSSSKPNLQNIPTRSELGHRCRALFIPEDDHLFGSVDYSQIEYRILCHLAVGEGSDLIREAFNHEPNLDIHQWCADLAGITRSQAKNINFGIIYGQGVAKTGAVLGLSPADAKDFLNRFNEKMPFAKYTANEATRRAEKRGWVKTILGRRRRFNKFVSAKWDDNKDVVEPLNYDAAVEKWGGNVKRAQTHKALNAVVQGSSADLIKLAMVNAYEKGIFNVLIPYTTVHDELNVSVPQTAEGTEAFAELVHTMETCYNFKVPILVDAGTGINWSEAKK